MPLIMRFHLLQGLAFDERIGALELRLLALLSGKSPVPDDPLGWDSVDDSSGLSAAEVASATGLRRESIARSLGALHRRGILDRQRHGHHVRYRLRVGLDPKPEPWTQSELKILSALYSLLSWNKPRPVSVSALARRLELSRGASEQAVSSLVSRGLVLVRHRAGLAPEMVLRRLDMPSADARAEMSPGDPRSDL